MHLVYVQVCKEDLHGRLKLRYLPRFCKVSGNTTSTFTTRCLATIVTDVGLPSKLRNWNYRACVTHYAFRLVKIQNLSNGNWSLEGNLFFYLVCGHYLHDEEVIWIKGCKLICTSSTVVNVQSNSRFPHIHQYHPTLYTMQIWWRAETILSCMRSLLFVDSDWSLELSAIHTYTHW